MSYKTQEIIWDIPLEDVQVGVSIGYEVEFSQKSYFNPILYKINTYDEVTASSQGTFYYSLDGGSTWIDFPVGNSGQVFNSAYKMKVVINVGESGKIFVEKGGIVYTVSGDGGEIIDQYTVGDFNSSGFEIDSQDNLYVTGQNETAYKIDTSSDLKPGKNSLNLHLDPLGIAVDGSRYFLWQIQRNGLYLRDLDYRTIFNISFPFEIDVNEYSSSSSSSSISSESSPSSSSVSSSSISSESSPSSSSVSSSSISSESSPSSSSVSSSSISSESSLSSIMGCLPFYYGSYFSTYTDANDTYYFSGYIEGKPYYVGQANGWTIKWNTMDAKWFIADTMSTSYYYLAGGDCPNGLYSRTSDDVLEGEIYT